MNKDEMIGLGLIGLPFVIAGMFIGGSIINKLNGRNSNTSIEIWRGTAEIFKEQLLREIDKNAKLSKELESKK